MEFIFGKDLDSECEKYWNIFKWFLLMKIQNKFQKNQVLEGKISWGRGNTWANGIDDIKVTHL
jgi:hypothetical protein